VQNFNIYWKLSSRTEPHLKSRVKCSYDEDADDVKIDVLDSKGQNLLVSGNPADLGHLVGEFKQSDLLGASFNPNDLFHFSP